VSLRSPALLLLVLLAAAGCGDDSETGSGDRPARPTGGEVVVQVTVEGGLLPPEAAVATVPSVTVLGDGTVITPAPVPEVYPGPALTPLQSVRVGAGVVDDLVAQARRLGLLAGPLDFGQPLVMDAPTTTVTITAGGTTHRHVAPALFEAEEPATGVGGRQAANRRALRSFVDETRELPPGEQPWVPPAIAVHPLGLYQPDAELPQKEVAWPLRRAPATEGSRPCTLFEGDQAAALLDVLARASARTPWVVDGTPHSLAFRPVLPGQPGCPS
jgi:hypothetical protein